MTKFLLRFYTGKLFDLNTIKKESLKTKLLSNRFEFIYKKKKIAIYKIVKNEYKIFDLSFKN